MMKSKALVYYGPGHLELEEISLISEEVVIQIKEVGICGTDLKTFLRGHHLFKPPFVLGHECYGVVVRTCSSKFKEGDCVVIAPYIECGQCTVCMNGFGELCKNKTFLPQGCFSQYIGLSAITAEKLLFPVQRCSSVLTLVEPLACVLNALGHIPSKTRNGANDVLVVGGGPMGAIIATYMSTHGADVSVVENSPWRAGYLKEKLNLSVLEPAKVSGKYDMIILCVDIPDLVPRYLSYLQDGGALLLFAGFAQNSFAPFDLHKIHYHELCVVGTTGYSLTSFSTALEEILEHDNIYNAIISHKLILADYEKAFALLKAKEAMKVLLTMNYEA